MTIENKEISCNKPLSLSSKLGSVISKISKDVFFIQQRIGKDGENFSIYKLKTMQDGSDNAIPKEVIIGNKSVNDKRILARRAWMRKTGFDELPQIVNILKGNMSFFGSRPISNAIYDNLSDFQKQRRSKYKPGIFGGYAFAYKGKRFSRRTARQNQDVYLRLRAMKEKKGKLAMFKYNSFILIENIKSLLKGVNR